MYEKLRTCILPSDDLVAELIEEESLEREIVRLKGGLALVEYLVDLDLVSIEKIRNVARTYIQKLMNEKERLGYLYFLADQNLMIPLQVQFKGLEVFADCRNKTEIADKISSLASEIACKGQLLYDITLLEIFYFYVRLANREMTWLAIESMLNNARQHTHLIMSPDRDHTYRIEAAATPPAAAGGGSGTSINRPALCYAKHK